MSEFKVSIDRNPDAAAPVAGPMQRAAEARKQNTEELLQRRKKIIGRASRESADLQAEKEREEPAPAEPREDLESVELALPDGRVVEIGPTPSVSLTMRLLHYYGGNEFSVADEIITKALMCVRTIDGQAVPTIQTPLDRDRLGHRLGDDGISLVTAAYRTYWPPLRINELPILKKTPRT